MIDKHMNEEKFMEYLAKQVSPAQLSTIYWCYGEIESFFQKANILNDSLFETTDMDILSKIQKTIERNKIFKIKYKKQYPKIIIAWVNYYRYIKEGLYPKDHPDISTSESTITEPEVSLAELANAALPKAIDGKAAKSLEDMLRDALKRESEQNKYGTTLVFLQQSVECGNANAVRSILGDATWAKLQYGRYFYVEESFEPVAEKHIPKSVEKGILNKVLAPPKTYLQNEFLPPVAEEDELLQIIKDAGLKFIDKRGIGGCLWVVTDDKHAECLLRCKAKGYEFRYTHNGSKTTDYMPAWYLTENESAPTAYENNEIDKLLNDEDFRLLRDELARQKITTIEALKGIKLWQFMNGHNLYSIGKRQAIVVKVQSILNPKKALYENQSYILHVGSSAYIGATAVEAYLHFCEDMARQYPLQFRTLIGTRISGETTTPISKNDSNGNFLKLENINAYISAYLPAIVFLRYARWICSMCGEKDVNVSLDAPQTPAPEAKPVSAPPSPTPQAAPAIQHASEHPLSTKDILMIHKVEQYVLKADMDGVSYDDVRDAMGITMVATRQLIVEAIHVVEIKGRLIHEESFVDWDEGANRMEGIVNKLIQKNNGYISCSQLYEYVRSEMNIFLNDNDVNEERTVYDIARHLFEKAGYHGKHYRFYGNAHISRPQDAISSNFDIIKKYAAEQGGVFSFSALGEYLEGVGVSSGNLRAQMRLQCEPVFFYYDEGILMFSESMHIDETWKASVRVLLDVLFADVGDHIILRKIPDIWFDRLPTLPEGRLWTPLLIQSVLRFYSEELEAHTIIAMEGQAIETLHTMLVSNDSPIQGFGDVVVSYLIESEIVQRDFEAEELRCQLVNAGIVKGNELIYNMSKALKNDERFAWDATGSRVTVKVG